MLKRYYSRIIEITEEAYKQNSVYRPWDEDPLSDAAGGGAPMQAEADAADEFAGDPPACRVPILPGAQACA
jgi:hypothetical protein